MTVLGCVCVCVAGKGRGKKERERARAHEQERGRGESVFEEPQGLECNCSHALLLPPLTHIASREQEHPHLPAPTVAAAPNSMIETLNNKNMAPRPTVSQGMAGDM